MLIKIVELSAFAVSAAAFIYGAFHLFRKGIPGYFRLYVCAAGCYMLEELWVIVNSLLGNGSEDGLVTVRLVGLFGCLCFMLSANANEFDRVVDEGRLKKVKLYALSAPVVLLALFSLYVFSPRNTLPPAATVIGFVSIAPALAGSYFSLKHLLLPEDGMGFLEAAKGIDITALVFYAANYIYPHADLICSKTVMSFCDLTIALILFGIVIMCRKGEARWKTRI